MATDPTKSSNEQRLRSVLAGQLTAAHELARLLDREACAIRDRDAEVLTDLASEKLQQLQGLETLEAQRNQFESDQGDSAPGSNGETSRLWQQVLDVIRVCDRKNQLNGAMLSLRQEHIQRALDLMADRDSAQMVYAPDGSTMTGSGRFGTSVSA